MSAKSSNTKDKSQAMSASQDFLFSAVSFSKAAGDFLLFFCAVGVLIAAVMLGLGYWFVAMADSVPVLPGNAKFADLPLATRLDLYLSLGSSASLSLCVGIIECIVQIIVTIIVAAVELVSKVGQMFGQVVVDKVMTTVLEDIMCAISKHANRSAIFTDTPGAVPAPI